MFYFLLLSAVLLTIVRCEECADKIEFHLGTKTPYRIVANKNYEKEDVRGCLKKIWIIARHGTRNPNANQIRKMQVDLHILRDIILEKNDNKNSKLLKSDLELFRNWKLRIEEADQKKLTIEGENEMLELAERMQARFPELLPSIYSNTSYKFKFTKTQRTKLSAKLFAVGLFGKKTARDVYFPEPDKQDLILRFYKLCAKWRSNVKENPDSLEERKKFEESELMKATIKKIESKLGLGDVLSFDNVHLMYTTCAFETAWSTKKKSPWCVPFDLETIKVMEYAEDLKYYWVDGYGYNLTYRQACPAFGNMIDFFNDEAPYPKAVIYFTHSGTLLKLLGHLGLYKDPRHLIHTDFHGTEDRKWRVSKIDTFGSNVAFILKRCGNESEVLALHNENIVNLPSCPNNDYCELEKLKKYYSESIDSCAFNKMCENDLKKE